MQKNRLILVTGPARSGKSEWAEALAQQSGQPVTYIATATVDPTDAEWQARIEQHRQRRPSDWNTVQVAIDLASTIQAATPQECLLIDSVGTWLANRLDADEPAWSAVADELLSSLQAAKSQIILVSEETGWGVVPAYPIGRQFRDRLGRLTRQMGAIADAVYLVINGYALDLKALGVSVDTGLPTNHLPKA